MMLDFELHAELDDHSVVEIGTIVIILSGNTVPIDKVVFDESGHNILGNRTK